MGLFDRFRKPPDETLHVYMPDGSKANLGDIARARSSDLVENAGVGDDWANPVYGSYAATSAVAYRAVMARSQAVRSAPLAVYRNLPGGDSEPVPDHPLQELLSRVNPWWTSGDLMMATEFNLSLWGSAYWFLSGADIGKVDSIWPLRPDRMKVIPGRPKKERTEDFAVEDYIAGFQYTNGNETVNFAPHEIVWFRYFNPMDEFAGLSPVASARISLDMGRNALKFNNAFFKNSAKPQDLVFFSNSALDDAQVESFYKRLEKRMRGPDNAWKPFIWDLTAGQKPERLGYTQNEMQFLQGLAFTVEEAARVWAVPPPVLMDQSASTFHNVSEAWQHFYTSTVSQEWDFLQDEMNELLLPNVGALASGDVFVGFDRTSILPLRDAADARDKSDLDKVQQGTMTINEYRKARNMPPVDWGDAWWIDGNSVSVGETSVQPDRPEPPTSAPKESVRNGRAAAR
jgi:HK97 family phage portal protein